MVVVSERSSTRIDLSCSQGRLLVQFAGALWSGSAKPRSATESDLRILIAHTLPRSAYDRVRINSDAQIKPRVLMSTSAPIAAKKQTWREVREARILVILPV